MKIGFDIDGVLATFDDAYSAILTRLTGLKFPPDSPTWPKTWDWDFDMMVDAGFSVADIKMIQSTAWNEIKDPSTEFWENLPPIKDNLIWAGTLQDCYANCFFITSRPGSNAKEQTERWLFKQFGYINPVIISSAKGTEAAKLELTHYIDDRAENILDVMEKSPLTRAYLLTKPYNTWATVPLRVDSVKEMVKREKL